MFSLLQVPISRDSREKVAEYIQDILDKDKKVQISTINPEFLVHARKNNDFLVLLQDTYNVPDGVGISIWSKILYKKSIHRYQGVELAEKVVEIATKNDKNVSLIGGFGVSESARKYLENKYGTKIVYAGDGDKSEIVEKLKQAKPQVLLVAFGSPAQEFFIQQAFKEIPSLQIGIGVGGTFDFWAGKVKRAPVWLQKAGLEWLFRLIIQPWRVGRIFRAVFVFSFWVLVEKCKKALKKF